MSPKERLKVPILESIRASGRYRHIWQISNTHVWEYLDFWEWPEDHTAALFQCTHTDFTPQYFVFNSATPFGKFSLSLPPSIIKTTLVYGLYKFSLFKTHPFTRKRRRSHLLRPKHLHFLRRFHTPLPTKPPTPSLHNLIRLRLKQPRVVLATVPPKPKKERIRPKLKLELLAKPLRASRIFNILIWSMTYPLFYPREGIG